MLITMSGVNKLRTLCHRFQEDAGDDFPAGVLRELLILHDICRELELNAVQIHNVLGTSAWECIQAHLESPACTDVNWERMKYIRVRP